MQLCDVNIYINAHREENAGHEFYYQWLKDQLESTETFLYCDWVFSAFLRVVTHPKIYKQPTPLSEALAFVIAVKNQPNALGIMPGARHWQVFEQLVQTSSATGNLVPDACFAALAIEANAVWVTADDDYKLFEPSLSWQLLRP